MKPIWLVFLLALAPARGPADESPTEMIGAFRFQEGLATVMVDGKYGYIDTHGRVVIAPAYEKASGMSGGRAAVTKGGETFVIDRSGKRLPGDPGPYLQYIPRGSPLAAFRETDSAGNARWGYKDRKGKVVIKPRFDYAAPFNDGLAAFAVKDPSMPGSRERWGYIDLKGNVVIPATFQISHRFSEGLAMTIHDYRHFFIDRKGKRAFDGDFSFAFDFSEGLAAVNIEPPQFPEALNVVEPGTWGYINKKGAFVLPAVYREARPFRNGVAAVMLNDKWGLIDKTGKFVVAARYREIRDVGEGLVAARMDARGDSKWSILTLRDEPVAPAIFDRVDEFSEGFLMVSMGVRRGYIDAKGKYIWEPTR